MIQYYERIKSHRGSGKAIIATARKFLGIIYNTLKNDGVFEDFSNMTALFLLKFLKEHVLVGHKILAELAHSQGKIYMLHSCGKLDAIMDYLIDEVGIDAKHSYEDAIMPVEKFYDQYRNRVGVLGGLDVNLLAGADEKTVRRRTREILDSCMPNGRFAFGSGNTITNYSKKANVLAMFDEAYQWRNK